MEKKTKFQEKNNIKIKNKIINLIMKKTLKWYLKIEF